MPSPSQFNHLELSSSERRILGMIFKAGSLTQLDIARVTGLTQQSVSRLTGGLLERDMLEEGKKIVTGKRGYPSISLKPRPGFAYAFGVSIMSDAVAVSLIDFCGSVLGERNRGFSYMGIEEVTGWLAETISELSGIYIPDALALSGIGIGISGSHIGDSQGYNTPWSLDSWADKDIGALLSPALGAPIWSENDGNVAALGENMIGVGRWADNFGYLYISSGVGGGIILDGELWLGRHGNAGEFAGGLPPNVFPFPNLELLRQLLVKEGHCFNSVYDMIAEFDIGWKAVDEWIMHVRDSVSIIASNLTAILDIEAIVLGGRIPRQLTEKLIPHIEFFDQKRRDLPRPTARLVPAEATGDATALGAALLPLRHLFFL